MNLCEHLLNIFSCAVNKWLNWILHWCWRDWCCAISKMPWLKQTNTESKLNPKPEPEHWILIIHVMLYRYFKGIYVRTREKSTLTNTNIPHTHTHSDTRYNMWKHKIHRNRSSVHTGWCCISRVNWNKIHTFAFHILYWAQNTLKYQFIYLTWHFLRPFAHWHIKCM